MKMLAQWIKCLDKRPSHRTDEDLEVIYKKLKSIRLFRRIHPSVVQQLCFVAYIEHIDKGVILFRQGDDALNWYAVIYGSLDVQVSHTGKRKDMVTLCTLGIGTAFGESVLGGGTHSVSVITNEPCTLLRVKRIDFQELWNKSSHLMDDIVSPLNCNNGKAFTKYKQHQWSKDNSSVDEDSNDNNSNNCAQHKSKRKLSVQQNDRSLNQIHHIGWVIRLIIMCSTPQLIRDRKFHLPNSTLYRKCIIGSELVDWILNITNSTQVRVHSRGQASAMCQVLLEDHVLKQVSDDGNPEQFMDKYVFYRFSVDEQQSDSTDGNMNSNATIDQNSMDEIKVAESELQQSLACLSQLAPDAIFRQILRKLPQDRTEEEIESVYEELIHIKALSHLSNSVKKELSSVIAFESHSIKGTVLFNQGDSGTCWYIILSGSVNVVIAGKGVVCTLHEGDDFGKLALVNEAPRAATIITSENMCQFLRVDKSHFDRILRDVEANTVRLKEHGKEVLVLQKMASGCGSGSAHNSQISHNGNSEQFSSHYKYMVMAGTPEKMLEHLLETRLDATFEEKVGDTLLQDFLLTYPIFVSWKHMCSQLMRYYRIDELNARQEKEFIVANKRRVVRFMHYWFTIGSDAFLKNAIVWAFVQDIMEALQKDSKKYNTFEDELLTIKTIIEAKTIYDLECDMRGIQKWKADTPGPVRRMSTSSELNSITLTNDSRHYKWNAIRDNDEIICRVYCADHTYTTLKLFVNTKAEIIKTMAAEKLAMEKFDKLILVELKSNGERLPFRDNEVSVATALTVNGRLFVSHIDHLDALTTLPEQDGPQQGTASQLDEYSSQELAYYLTLNGWQLFSNLHEYELIYHVFGRHNFNEITANLDLFLRHFNETQYWVITEIVVEKSLSRRVQLLRKFIKIAGHCKDYQNLNIFFAIIMGLSNVAVSRLTQTWERLPNKIKRTFSQYECLIDPSRNHRRYRIMVSKLTQPIIPFMPLLLKDMTFAHEGNKTYVDQGLVNFEKMHMIAQTLHSIRDCKSGTMRLEAPQKQSLPKSKSNAGSQCAATASAMLYLQDIKVIDCQRRLTQLSHSLEHRKT